MRSVGTSGVFRNNIGVLRVCFRMVGSFNKLAEVSQSLVVHILNLNLSIHIFIKKYGSIHRQRSIAALFEEKRLPSKFWNF